MVISAFAQWTCKIQYISILFFKCSGGILGGGGVLIEELGLVKMVWKAPSNCILHAYPFSGKGSKNKQTNKQTNTTDWSIHVTTAGGLWQCSARDGQGLLRRQKI